MVYRKSQWKPFLKKISAKQRIELLSLAIHALKDVMSRGQDSVVV